MIDGSGHRGILDSVEPLSPKCNACRRIKCGHSLWSPDNELPLAARANYDWRTGRRLLVQRFPDLFARGLVKRNDASVRLCAHRNDQNVSLDQGRSRGVEVSVGIFLLDVLLPDYVAFQRIETEKIACCSPSIDSPVRDDRSRNRPT